MSSTKATSVNYSVRPFFGFILRQNWQHFALYTILALLVMFVPCLLSFTEGIPDFTGYDTGEEYLISQMNSLNMIAVILSGGIGILAGMSAVGYINNKSHVGCWHSFPISRTKMYLIETSVRAIYFTIAILVGFVSSHILAAVVFGFIGIPRMLLVMLVGLMQAVCCYLIVYSVTLLAGGLCGTSPMRFIMLCIISFLPVALYALFVYLFSDGMMIEGANLYESFYFNDSFMEVICLPYRVVIFAGLEGNYSVFQCLWLIPEAALYYIGGLLLHKYRKSEATGTTIVWKPVFTAVKYVILFTCGLFGMFAIGSEYVTGSDSVLRAVLGTLIGLIIAFIVMNAILYKSSRSMFKGIRPFLACTAVTLVFVFLIPLNITGLVGRDYSAPNVKRLEIDGMTFTDPDTIDTLMELMLEDETIALPSQSSRLTMDGDQEYLEKWFPNASDPKNWDSKYTELGLEIEPSYTYWLSSIRVIEYPKFGIPFAKSIEIDKNSAFWQTVRLSQEYRDAHDVSGFPTDEVYEIDITIGEESLYMYQSNGRDNVYGSPYVDVEAATVEYISATLSESEISVHYAGDAWNAPAQAILDACVFPEGYPDQPIVGRVWVMCREGNTSRSYTYPVYADNVALINEFGRQTAAAKEQYSADAQKFYTVSTAEDVIAQIVPEDTQAVLVNYETSEAKKLDYDELCTLLSDAVTVGRTSRWDNTSNTLASTVPYAIYISRGSDSSHNEIRFRRDAVTEEEIAEIFASLD